MKRFYVFIILLHFVVYFTSAQNYTEYDVITPGTLSTLCKDGEKITNMRLTGMLNGDDLLYIKSLSSGPTSRLNTVDMSAAIMVGDSIPSGSFADCYIKEYKLPSSLRQIGSGAFKGNKRTKEIIVPESVSSIGNEVFSRCPLLKKVVLPAQLETIPYEACAYSRNLENITMPSELREMQSRAFYLCDSLYFEELPSSLEIMGSSLFSENKKIKKLVIPGKVRVMDGSLSYMDSLQNVVITSNVLKKIGDYSFFWDLNLRRITIPEGVEEIGAAAFDNDSRLDSVELPKTIKKIGRMAFNSAIFKSIIIPDGVEEIGSNNFPLTIEEVYAGPRQPALSEDGDTPFHNYMDYSKITLYVHKGCAEAYAASPLWNIVGKIVEVDDDRWPVPTSISLPLADGKCKVYADGCTLHITTDGSIRHADIFTTDGTKVFEADVSGDTAISMPRGIYVVKIGGSVYKLSV